MMCTEKINVGVSPPALYPLSQVAGPQLAPMVSGEGEQVVATEVTVESEQVVAAEVTDEGEEMLAVEVTDEGEQVVAAAVTDESELKVAPEITDEIEILRRDTPNEQGSPPAIAVVPTNDFGKIMRRSSSKFCDYLIYRVGDSVTSYMEERLTEISEENRVLLGGFASLHREIIMLRKGKKNK